MVLGAHAGEKHEYLYRDSCGMRERADWMHPADDHLLVLLRAGRKDTFNAIAAQLPLDGEQVGERCRALADYGLVEHLGSDIYTLSRLGEQYLDGEVDLSQLDRREE